MNRVGNFLRDVGREMKKVSWPKKNELTRYTITVISTVLFMTLFFVVVDYGISSLIRLIP
ncbi:preprotein translocase subunit SecE [Priestia megaterium]|uniref:preprotein translocase subunit SecE n=1 Tax=Priestia megaterium TaxID=1404 RepID=UPI002FE300EB